MIAVVGEALVDLVIDPAGRVTAALGGAPFNTARACGRLGVDVAFIGAMSTDRFGTMLRDRLIDDGVDVARAPLVDRPTTLAAAELDERGTASYRFYVDGTSAPLLDRFDVTDAGPPDVVVTGGLAFVLEPMASSVESMLGSLPRSTLVVIDVNCRPLVIGDRATYLDRVGRVLRSAHVVKVSDEDLVYLDPDADPMSTARRLVPVDRPGAVLVTGGAGGVRIIRSDGDVTVPVAAVDVVDTIGAGDTFTGAFVSWWSLNGLAVADVSDLARLERAVAAASVAAGVACTRRGAEPPRRNELAGDWSS